MDLIEWVKKHFGYPYKTSMDEPYQTCINCRNPLNSSAFREGERECTGCKRMRGEDV